MTERLDYESFLASKLAAHVPCGFEPAELNDRLFPFQGDVTRWGLRLGRAAVFADCGMGKTPIQLEWAHRVAEHTGGRVLILAPLAVAAQTVREGAKFDIEAKYSRNGRDLGQITVANYEMLDHFNPSDFVGVVLDESSILKAYDGKTRTRIIEAFRATPYRLACTATPAPNDHVELGNHAEFLGIMSRTEMLSMYFVHDGGETQNWRLKGHAQDDFWRWVASWAVMLRKPSDIGHSDEGYDLPPLTIHEHVVEVDQRHAQDAGMLFAFEAQTLQDQRAARRASLDDRVSATAALVNADRQPWLVWGELNDECDALERLIPDAVQVAGTDSNEDKESALMAFVAGETRVLVSKVTIAGFGMNFQHCAREAFVGASHSFEQTYQAIRRCWRFGQKKTVEVHMVRAETDGAIVANLRRKEADAERMAAAMVYHMRDFQTAAVRGSRRMSLVYNPTQTMALPSWIFEEAT